jgi:hypothetical protein
MCCALGTAVARPPTACGRHTEPSGATYEAACLGSTNPLTSSALLVRGFISEEDPCCNEFAI